MGITIGDATMSFVYAARRIICCTRRSCRSSSSPKDRPSTTHHSAPLLRLGLLRRQPARDRHAKLTVIVYRYSQILVSTRISHNNRPPAQFSFRRWYRGPRVRSLQSNQQLQRCVAELSCPWVYFHRLNPTHTEPNPRVNPTHGQLWCVAWLSRITLFLCTTVCCNEQSWAHLYGAVGRRNLPFCYFSWIYRSLQ